jgi:hypothetical protein
MIEIDTDMNGEITREEFLNAVDSGALERFIDRAERSISRRQSKRKDEREKKSMMMKGEELE